ncbi:MAG: TonB-dependent receptor [Caulobacteraceae bacterium]
MIFRAGVASAAAMVGTMAVAVAAVFGAGGAYAEPVTVVDPLVVTATRTPIAASRYPGMVTVLDGNELRARGATDLRAALSLVAGVDAPPGGDAGPAGAVPAFWGLQEFDAFLLIVDGVPVGGAFNPAIPTLDFTNVERIEVLRGSAPVTYGATSFVGVIQVFHYAAGQARQEVGVSAGTQDKAATWATFNLPQLGDLGQTLSLRAETSGFSQERSGYDRFHGLYRLGGETALGRMHFDLDGVILRQDPYSPHPREGSGLSIRLPLDSNINPTDARADQDRVQATLGLDRDLAGGVWSTTLSASHSRSSNTRGFLREDFADDGVMPNADGYRQTVKQTDVYFDTHATFHPNGALAWTLGADWLYGDGEQSSENFEYAVFPNGSNAPLSTTLPIDEATFAGDTRSFGGIYALGKWAPNDRLLVTGGLRLNYTSEDRKGEVVFSDGSPTEQGSDSASKTRLSGAVGVSYAVWREGQNHLTGFINYRDTYKPAAVDFGPEGEGEILKPETARSWEGGVKGMLADGRFEWEASLFQMDFKNLVIRENIGGLPGLANAGAERFEGAEVEGRWRVTPELSLMANYAWHKAQFTDYARLRPDGTIQQLAGKDLELSPRQIAGVGLLYMPEQGLQATAVVRHVGERFLNKSNTVLAPGYTAMDASVGYAMDAWTVRVVGQNLTDRRDPVAESELGDAQFYTMPGRTVRVELMRGF